MWGANAVNGVIHISTKRAVDTHGGLFVADAGSDRPAEGSLRFGGALGRSAFYRVFGRQTTRSDLVTNSGASGSDSWNMTNLGLRLDLTLSKADSLTVEGEAYRGVVGQRSNVLTSISPIAYDTSVMLSDTGGHVLTRWNHTFRGLSNLTLQAFYDKTNHTGFNGKDIHTFDTDLQYSVKIGERHDVVLGFGWRQFRDNFHDSQFFGLTPSHAVVDTTTGFVQDEITLARKKLYLTVGAKAEHGNFSGNNVQPSVHLAWLLTPQQSVWLSASRAVRTANRVERGMYAAFGAFPAGPQLVVGYLYGQESARSEGLNALETGYRFQPNRKLWLDIAFFYNVYDHLSTTAAGKTFFQPGPTPYFVSPLYFGNNMKGETYGTEVAANYKVLPALSLKGSYSFLRLALHGYNGTVTSESAEGQSPRRQVYIGSFVNLPRSFEISAHAYFVGALPNFQTPAYTRLDLDRGWKGLENLELNLVGQNLLGSHMEFGGVQSPANAVERNKYGKIAWRF